MEPRHAAGRTDTPSPHCATLRRLFPRMLGLLAEGDARLGAGARDTFVEGDLRPQRVR